MADYKEKLKEVVEWLNENYNQDSENYCIFNGAKPEVIRFDENTALSLWACGAIVCIHHLIYFIKEDDGHWFCENYVDKRYVNEEGYVNSFWLNRTFCGLQSCFSLGWVDSFTTAMKNLKEYVDKNGTAVCYSGTDIVCHYTL
jgi:hypothetical protein